MRLGGQVSWGESGTSGSQGFTGVRDDQHAGAIDLRLEHHTPSVTTRPDETQTDRETPLTSMFFTTQRPTQFQ